MGFLNKAKDAAEQAVDKAGDKIGGAVDKAKHLIDEKTGHKFDDKTEVGAEKAKDALDGLDGKDDDIS
jgi:hypothetical protein